MELAIPGVALGLLYVVSKQNGERDNTPENFTGNNGLPNTNIPDKNYPSELPVISSELDKTSALSRVNRFDSNGVYTCCNNILFLITFGQATPNNHHCCTWTRS